MSRRTAIIVLASVALVIGLSVLIGSIPFTNIDPESMPSGTLQYMDQEDMKQTEPLSPSAYHWELNDPSSEEIVWQDVDPENIFHLKYATKEIMPGELEINLQLVWLESPDNIKIKRWPMSEWAPDDYDASHTKGEDVDSSWETHWKKTDIGFAVERGSLYGIWIYYGNSWVQYSFIVPGEDPTSYDYLGYCSGFENPKVLEFALDPIEWIDSSNADRIKALNLNQDDDFPSGFYIYNPKIEAMPLRLTDQTKYLIIDPETGNTTKTVGRSEFLNYLNKSPSFYNTKLFWISETNGNVEFIKEQYVP